MYLEFIYSPTSLFSLKSSEATNSASKSLLIPSPYSIKMALLNATHGEEFETIRDLQIHIGFKGNIIANNSFLKLQKENRDKSIAFQSTVGFREYLFLDGKLHIAVENGNMELVKWFAKINYFGKRGSFFQLTKFGKVEKLENFYMKPLEEGAGIVQSLDDMSKKAKFENVSNYHGGSAKREKKFYTLPFRFGKRERLEQTTKNRV
jgi:hypothetical protein